MPKMKEIYIKQKQTFFEHNIVEKIFLDESPTYYSDYKSLLQERIGAHIHTHIEQQDITNS